MTTRQTTVLVQTKLKLAEKYARLAARTKSQPKRATFSHRAVWYRHQAEELSRK